MIRRYIIVAEDSLKGFDEAIEKLEREWGAEEIEPCEDAISRQAVIELVEGWWIGHTKEDDLATELRQMPSVQPKLAECEDAISREAVLNHICESKECYKEDCKGKTYQRCVDLQWVYDLPSVTPTKKGGWIHIDNMNNATCSICGIKAHASYNFCPICGADMRGDADE